MYCLYFYPSLCTIYIALSIFRSEKKSYVYAWKWIKIWSLSDI